MRHVVLQYRCQENVIDTTRSIIQDGKGLALNTPSCSSYSGSSCVLPALSIREVVAYFLLFLFGK
jgi:hypothetical protein